MHFALKLKHSTGSLLLLALLLALLGGGASVADEPPTAAAPGKLPKGVMPIHYRIELRPDLDKAVLPGSEVIDIEVSEPTDRIVLNAVEMTFDRAELEDEDGQIAAVTLDAKAQTATLTFPRPISAGPHRLDIVFAGRINSFGRGLFAVDYPTETGRKRMIASHLEPADARRIFPCWDEPALKARFEPTVTVPETYMAISNMTVAREEPAGTGLKRVSFTPTPPMSSYLFVLAAGELERISAETDGVEIGVVSTAGKKERGRYALDSAIALLRYYNKYFGVAYPLPKLDLIAVPGGFGGAMENWGGIIFFESRLLFDPASSSQRLQRDIFAVLAHEMAHQWFGDLVTMAWWDDLWLNEGFASWMEAKAAERLNPSWTVWLDTTGVREAAMNADARRTSHPIQQPVADESEAMIAFDSITYNKGRAFIRQLEAYLGEDAFRDGIRRYMADHAYGNATTADLWQALEAAPGTPVAVIAAGYTKQSGVPLVRAEALCVGGTQHLHLAQERFTIRPADGPRLWEVPITLAPKGAAQLRQRLLLSGSSDDVTVGQCGEPIKLNLGGVGYYPVQYDEATLHAFAASFGQLMPADRVNLLADSWALVEGGRMAPADYFALLEAARGDNTRALCQTVIRAFDRLDHLERHRPQRAALRAFARHFLRSVFDRLGWQAAAGEPPEHNLLRAELIASLGNFGDSDILAEASRRFARFREDPASLEPELRGAVLHLAGRSSDRDAWSALLALGRQATVAEERVRFYFALASALDPVLARDTLAIALGDELPANLATSLIYWVASAGEHPDLAWEFVETHFDPLAARLGPSFRDFVAANLMTNFTDRAQAAELAHFAPAQASSGARIATERAEEVVVDAADFSERTLPVIENRLAAHPAP